VKLSPPAWLLRFALVSLGLAATPLRAQNFVQTQLDAVTYTGDGLAYVMPAAAYGVTWYHKDAEGALEFTKAAAISMGITVVLKYSIDSQRPNGEPHSFPSGHATITFSTAEFLRKRYGNAYGIPAYVLATYVGFSRVHAHVHYFRDVAAGAVIGITTTYFVTTPFHGWQVEPKVGARYLGLGFSRGF